MKEHDVRDRVSAFLRMAAVPVGIALAGGGCIQSEPVYSAPMPDGGKDLAATDSAGEAATWYGAPMPDASPLYAAPAPTPSGDDTSLRSR